MKKLFFTVCVLLLLGSSAFGLTMSDVGLVDTIYAYTTLSNSGDQTELNWIQYQLGSDIYISEQYLPGSAFEQIEGESYIYAMELDYIPEYYYIKIGGGNLPDGMALNYIYQNQEELSYAVINILDWYTASGLSTPSLTNENLEVNIGRISHLRDIGAAPVPEPATMLLLGTGLIGLAVTGRKKFIK